MKSYLRVTYPNMLSPIVEESIQVSMVRKEERIVRRGEDVQHVAHCRGSHPSGALRRPVSSNPHVHAGM